MTYSYQVSSSVRRVREGDDLRLGTSGGRTEAGPAAHPRGFLTEPGPAALGMLACAAVARVKGFGEVQALARPMRPVAELASADARRSRRLSRTSASCLGSRPRTG